MKHFYAYQRPIIPQPIPKLLLTFVLLFTVAMAYGQTVSGTPSRNGCKNGNTISITSSFADPQYQLRDAATNSTVRPTAGNDNAFAVTIQFSGLSNGSYRIVARNGNDDATRITSGIITVDDGYTDLKVTANPSKPLLCANGKGSITLTAIGGNPGVGGYSYRLTNAPAGYPDATTITTTNSSVTFNNLPIGSYDFTLTDACGTVITTSATITNIPFSLDDVTDGGGVPAEKRSQRLQFGSTVPVVVPF